MSIVLPLGAVSTARRAAGFSQRRPAALVWLALYAVVAVSAPSPATLAVTAALAGVLVLRLRLARLALNRLEPTGLEPAERAASGHRR